MFLPILGIVIFLALALIVLIMWLTRESAGHNIRHDVREAVIEPRQHDKTRGIRR